MTTFRRRGFRDLLVLGYAMACCSMACSKPAPSSTPTIPVTVALVTRGPAPNIVTGNGIVTPIRTANVAAQVSGLVTEVTFREGDMAHRGQVLFRIEPRPYAAAVAQAEATLAHDEAQATNAERGVERFDALLKDDYVTRSAADSQRTNLISLSATVNADRAALSKARFDLENTVIRAPIAGRTGSVLVKEGNLVVASPAQPLVVINQIDPIQVRFDLPSSVFRAIQIGSRSRELPARIPLADSGLTVSGHLTFIDNAIDTATGTVQLKANFANTNGRLWPGQFVPVSLELDVQPNALLIPSSAVQAGQQGNFVFVVGADNKTAMRPISTGQTVGSAVVATRGLVTGERVVIDGQARLGTGTPVRIVATQPPSQLAKENTP